jgi:DNA-binding NarL/FixJ family response regulator
MKPIRILLADDHELVRAGIRALLQKIKNVEVVAEAENGNQALQLMRQLKPDIVLMDISMPELNGLAATAQAKQEFPEIPVIILSMHADKEYVLQALNAGARGYLLKGARVPELELALGAIARGETYLSPAASQHLISAVQNPSGASVSLQQLTERQRQVLRLIAHGEGRKSIALKLKISPKTVDTYRAQLMQQLDIHDIAGLVRFAIKNHLIDEV